MSAPAYAPPQDVEPSKEIQRPSPQDIAELAYARWQERGYPDGSPDEDWLEAESRLRGGHAATSKAGTSNNS